MTAQLKFVSIFVLCLHVAVASPTSRIWGGENAASGAYPWVASVRVNNVHVCTGSIVSNTKILTSGHCVSQNLAIPISASTVNVRVGSINQFAGGKIVSVQSIDINPQMGSFLHDLAILTLSAPLQFTTKIQKIDIADADFVLENDSPVTVTGWGVTKDATPYKLQQATFSVYSPQLCEMDVSYGYSEIVCIKHKVNEGICTGDDGAGVISNGKVVGVVSFAFGACGTELPDIAAKTSAYYQWIQEVLAK